MSDEELSEHIDNMFVSFDTPLDDETVANIKQRWMETYIGGDVAVVYLGMWMNREQLSDYVEALANRIYDMGISFEEGEAVVREAANRIDWDHMDQLMARREATKRQGLYEGISAWLPDRVAWWVSLKWPERWLPR